jgi:hypothetical protein
MAITPSIHFDRLQGLEIQGDKLVLTLLTPDNRKLDFSITRTLAATLLNTLPPALAQLPPMPPDLQVLNISTGVSVVRGADSKPALRLDLNPELGIFLGANPETLQKLKRCIEQIEAG